MKTYNQIHLSQISEILMQAALGVSAVCGFKYVTSDMVYSLNHLNENITYKEPFFIAIREQGTESGNKECCLDRCKALGYPIVIAKIDKDRSFDYNMTIMFTWNRDYTKMEQEFDLL